MKDYAKLPKTPVSTLHVPLVTLMLTVAKVGGEEGYTSLHTIFWVGALPSPSMKL